MINSTSRNPGYQTALQDSSIKAGSCDIQTKDPLILSSPDTSGTANSLHLELVNQDNTVQNCIENLTHLVNNNETLAIPSPIFISNSSPYISPSLNNVLSNLPPLQESTSLFKSVLH